MVMFEVEYDEYFGWIIKMKLLFVQEKLNQKLSVNRDKVQFEYIIIGFCYVFSSLIIDGYVK